MNRTELILELVRGKEVLDVGCTSVIKSGRLFIDMEKVTKKITGVDINPIGVKYMRGKGYDVEQGDFEEMLLFKKFEVVVAGDIIEHVRNQGDFLKNCKRHMKEGGVLIITTANPFAGRVILRALLGRNMLRSKTEHTFYTDKNTLRTILSLYGLRLVRTYFCFDDNKNFKTLIEKILFTFIKRLQPEWVAIVKNAEEVV